MKLLEKQHKGLFILTISVEFGSKLMDGRSNGASVRYGKLQQQVHGSFKWEKANLCLSVCSNRNNRDSETLLANKKWRGRQHRIKRSGYARV